MRLIDADALVEAIKDYPYGFRGMIVCDIAKQPTIEPKKGKWIEENRRPKSSAFYCSVCHRTAYDQQNHRADVPKRCRYAFCPNCGARMESE